MLISKDDHRKFVDHLHSLHRQELKKAADANATQEAAISLAKQHLSAAIKNLEEETQRRIAVQNELQYKKAETQRLADKITETEDKIMRLLPQLKEKESCLADTTVKLNAEMTKRKEIESKLA